MAALFKYFVGIAVILPAVMIVMPLSAVNMGEIFVGTTAIAQARPQRCLDGTLNGQWQNRIDDM